MADDPQEAGESSQTANRADPPAHARFRKGMSGNPKGRPKGTKNLATIMREAARAPVIANIGGQQRKISTLQATAWQLATQAAKGDQRAVVKFLEWMDEFEKRAAANRPIEFPLSEPDLEVLRAIHDRMQHCKPDEPTE
jgi:hypothetical protein